MIQRDPLASSRQAVLMGGISRERCRSSNFFETEVFLFLTMWSMISLAVAWNNGDTLADPFAVHVQEVWGLRVRF